MQYLNLPAFSHKIKESEGKKYIFDAVRKKYVFLSPEEWVRQHLMHYLMMHVQIPKSLIRIESSLSYNKLQKRSDLQVYNRDGQIFLLAECKSPEINLNEKTVKQVCLYNETIKAPYLLITNGIDLFCWSSQKDDIEFLEKVPSLPD
ncbi:type I restriction enzyme HsdR N-terminal domain-containing protein [Hyphobacterium sp. CCMP332]|nr:type I restriction enzyme HsdR N-terminal domain-containing protein [Hyphobacterium sp. CCMP332]